MEYIFSTNRNKVRKVVHKSKYVALSYASMLHLLFYVCVSLWSSANALLIMPPSYHLCPVLSSSSGESLDSATSLRAKNKGTRQQRQKLKRSGSSHQKRNKGKNDVMEEEVLEVSSATNRIPAVLSSSSSKQHVIVENHAHEQFFYSDQTSKRLFKLTREFEYPLLLCNPSLAVLSEESQDTEKYLLLDLDERFERVLSDGHFEKFHLINPHIVRNYPYDSIFVDPPFSNVTPKQLVNCIMQMAPSPEQRNVPVYVAYPQDREEQLVSAFDSFYDGPSLEKKWKLNYKSGISEETADRIWLYGPSFGNYPF